MKQSGVSKECTSNTLKDDTIFIDRSLLGYQHHRQRKLPKDLSSKYDFMTVNRGKKQYI